MVEHQSEELGVGGSIPPLGTIFFLPIFSFHSCVSVALSSGKLFHNLNKYIMVGTRWRAGAVWEGCEKVEVDQ